MARSQDGIRSALDSRNFSTSNMFTGVWNLNSDNLDSLDPFIGGYAQIIWTKLPEFFGTTKTGSSATFKEQFKSFTENNFKSFSGIGDLTLDQDQMSHGFAGNEIPVPTNLKKENTSFTLKHYELVGSPCRELYMYWITGIRDPETGLATYHGAIADGTLQYSLKNHTAELLYTVTDPSFAVALSNNSNADGNTSGIEFACYYTNVFPTKIPQDHLNYSSGDHPIVEIDIEFRGCFHMGSKINAFAKQAMANYTINKSYGDYDPTITVSGSGTETLSKDLTPGLNKSTDSWTGRTTNTNGN